MKVRYGVAAGVLLGCLVPAVASAQSASGKASAEALFEQGRRLISEGKIAEACPAFADSQKLDPSSSTLLNLGSCYEKIGKTASAWATYQEAASLAQSNGRGEHLEAAQKRASILLPKLVRVTVSVESPAQGLEVRRNGGPVARAEWGLAIPVDPGSVTYEAVAPHHRAWSTTIEVDPNRPSTSVVIPALEELPPEPVAVGPQAQTQTFPMASAPEAKPFRVSQTALALVAGGVGVVGLGVGSIFAMTASSKYDDSLQNCPRDKNVCNADGLQQRDSARTSGNVATVAFAVGALALTGGAVLWLTKPRNQTETKTPSVGLSPALGGAAMQGTW